MKPQEIFDAASVHLMGMDGPSLDMDACVYRGHNEDCEFNGQMCAVGLFIADEHYDWEFEGKTINANDGAIANAVAKSWGQDNLTFDQIELLADLQTAHDDASRGDDWSNLIRVSLDKVADKHHLRFDPKEASA